MYKKMETKFNEGANRWLTWWVLIETERNIYDNLLFVHKKGYMEFVMNVGIES